MLVLHRLLLIYYLEAVAPGVKDLLQQTEKILIRERHAVIFSPQVQDRSANSQNTRSRSLSIHLVVCAIVEKLLFSIFVNGRHLYCSSQDICGQMTGKIIINYTFFSLRSSSSIFNLYWEAHFFDQNLSVVDIFI